MDKLWKEGREHAFPFQMRIYSGAYFASHQLNFACQPCAPKKESRITASNYIANSIIAEEGTRTAFPFVNVAQYKAQ